MKEQTSLDDLPEWQKEFRRVFDCGWKEDGPYGLYRFTFRATPETYERWRAIAYG